MGQGDAYGIWYTDNIEEPIRHAVYVLRNNGINTVYSCGCAMVIEADFVDFEQFRLLKRLLQDNGYKIARLSLIDFFDSEGQSSRRIRIALPKADGFICKEE